MKVAFVVISIFVLCFVGSSSGATLCSIVASTAKIIGKLCYANGGANKNNQQLIDGFFGCYDNAPGKAQFVKCQTQQFGGALDNVQAVTASCSDQTKLPGYARCLRTEFKNAGIDMNSAVETLNACQSQVLGIRTGRSFGCGQ